MAWSADPGARYRGPTTCVGRILNFAQHQRIELETCASTPLIAGIGPGNFRRGTHNTGALIRMDLAFAQDLFHRINLLKPLIGLQLVSCNQVIATVADRAGQQCPVLGARINRKAGGTPRAWARRSIVLRSGLASLPCAGDFRPAACYERCRFAAGSAPRQRPGAVGIALRFPAAQSATARTEDRLRLNHWPSET